MRQPKPTYASGNKKEEPVTRSVKQPGRLQKRKRKKVHY